MRRVGYARVSTQEQKEDRQIDELRALGIKDKDLSDNVIRISQIGLWHI